MGITAIVQGFRDWRDRRAAFKEIRHQVAEEAPYRGFELSKILTRIKAGAFQENRAAVLAAWHELNAMEPDIAMTSSTALRALSWVKEHAMVDELLVKALAKYPNSSELAHLYAEVAQLRGHWEESNRRWENVRKRFPHVGAAWSFAAIGLIELGRFDEADDVLRQGIARDPKDSMAQFQYARAAERREDWEEALTRWQQALEQITEDVVPFVETAKCLRRCNREAEAIALLKRACWRFQSSYLPLIELARIPHDRGDYEEAWHQWDAIQAGFPRAAGAYYFGAEALKALGRHGEAEDLLLRGADRLQGSTETGPAFAYAATAHNRRDWPEAARRWALMRDWYPEAKQAYTWGADALEFDGDKDGAEKIRVLGRLLGGD